MEEIGSENVHKQQAWRKLENPVKQSRFKHLGELHKEWTEAEVIKNHHAQKSSEKGLPSHYFHYL